MSRGFVNPARDGAEIKLRISPGARGTSVAGPYGEDAIKLRVAAPPAKGKANDELKRYVAKLLGIAASDASVVSGASSRSKVLLVRGVEPEDVREILSGHLP